MPSLLLLRSPTQHRGSRRQLRLAIGALLILAGVFICLSVVSYFFTWRADQDALINTGSVRAFLRSKEAVANWGGRLGAALGHYLVFRGAGLASLAIGLYTTIIGLHIVYKRRAAPLMRYLRWLCLVLLVLAPILAYVFPHASFPYGGALGNEAVNYSNGFIGRGGYRFNACRSGGLYTLRHLCAGYYSSHPPR